MKIGFCLFLKNVVSPKPTHMGYVKQRINLGQPNYISLRSSNTDKGVNTLL